MEIGNIENFMAQQTGKVKRRQEEMKKIAQGIYRTQVLLDAETMETFEKECKRNQNKATEAVKEKDSQTIKANGENATEEKQVTDYQALFEEKKAGLHWRILS